jgi:hypothetical protein
VSRVQIFDATVSFDFRLSSHLQKKGAVLSCWLIGACKKPGLAGTAVDGGGAGAVAVELA